MDKVKLLIAEDDENLGQILKEYLEIKGYDADLCRDGEAGLTAFKDNTYDACLLDVMMPKKDGFTLAKDIRALDVKVPIIFLTAKSMQEDKLKGLKIGADDYITKPFSMEELILRLQAILKRTDKGEKKQSKFDLGIFKFDHIHQTLSHEDEIVKLTSKEADLLLLLSQNMNEITNRSAALNIIWGDDSYFNARSMDVYITKLRKRLQADDQVQIITAHGQGFRLVVDA
jgi:DNA-binding response OmpR family regulator